MRKLLVTITIAAACLGMAAQETATQSYLPQKGDWAFGVDVVPLLKTIGGSYNSNEEPGVGGTVFSPDIESTYVKPNVSVMGKYMLTDKWAVKVNLGVVFTNKNRKLYTTDDLSAAIATGEEKVVDARRSTRSGGSLMAGMEYRLGSHRVQGVFGAGLLFGFTTDKVKYSYGNTMTDLNQHPTTAFPYPDGAGVVPDGYRVISNSFDGPNFVVGAYGSAGVEWFVAPKISLGASVDLYLYGALASKGIVKSEGYSEAYQKVVERTDLYTPGNTGFNFGTDNIGGSLYMTFYF